MKIIKISNGEIRIGYEYSDLSDEVKKKVMDGQIQFEIDIMDEDSPYWCLAEEMEKMQTPWFLGEAIFEKHEQDLIEMMGANGYFFTEDGVLLPITYHTNNGIICNTTFGSKEYECRIFDSKL